MLILAKNIGDSLDDLGYPNLNELENYLADLNNVNLSKLVHWLSINLNRISSFESIVNEIDNELESDSFKIELNSLLKELGSPYSADNLNDLTNKLTILNYLCGELLAVSIDFVKRSKDDHEYDESEIAKQLRLILMTLIINRPPTDATIKQIFDKIIECIDEEFSKKGIVIEDSVLFKGSKQINPKIWSKLNELNEMLKEEYEIRRRTLIKRSDCSCASFKWKKEHQNDELEKKIDEVYSKFNYLLERDITIDISDLMAIKPTDYNHLNNTVISKSHQYCTIIPPENSQLANQGIQQKLSLHKFIIGQVPDRGGRTEEAIKPVQETFAQQQNQREQQQQRMNKGNSHHNQGNRQNFNLNPNRVQGSGWNQNQYQGRNSWGGNNRNFTDGQSGDFHNNRGNKNYQNNQRNNYYAQDESYVDGNHGNQQRGHYYGGNRNEGGQYSNRGGRGRGRY